MPFGVVLPDNMGGSADAAPTEELAPEGAQPDIAPEGAKVSAKAPEPETIKELLDLEKQERFRFAGKEWTPKELMNSYLMRDDYTRKTQELAETRKYAENFVHDLRTLVKEPNRINEFRSLYPSQYVERAMQILQMTGGNHQTSTAAPTQTDPREDRISFLESKIGDWEKAQYTREVESIQSWLDNQFDTLGKRYPFANHEAITARAQVLSDRGEKITPEILDRLFKANNTEIKDSWEKMYRGKVETQLKQGQKGKDIGAGGGTPSAPPVKLKTMQDAKKAWLAAHNLES